ncbi:hypothetical protein B0H14DRAFT_1087148 [Mycena olivaceomarginata]|nr:hypothetical protein B0H14DRAFT_1087148 [Mycena olivaceomarginata]
MGDGCVCPSGARLRSSRRLQRRELHLSARRGMDRAPRCAAPCRWLLSGSWHGSLSRAGGMVRSAAPPRIGGIRDGGRAASDLEGCGGLGAGDWDESGDGDGDANEDADQDEGESGGWRRRGTGWKGGRRNVWVCLSGAPLWSSPRLLVCHEERASRAFPGCACFAVVRRRAQPRRVSLWNTTTHPTTARRQSTTPPRTLAPHSLAPPWIARGALSAPPFQNAAAPRMSPASFPQTRTGGRLH